MKRHIIKPRNAWQQKVEELGFAYHTLDGETYWDESVYYEFNYAQINQLEQTTNQLYRLCLKAVDYVIKENLFDWFFIPEEFIPLIKKSWKYDFPSIYGRYDISWNGDLNSPPKMLEFNADTPTSLFEASVIQWFWLKEFNNQFDQFNSIHEKIISSWKKIKPQLRNKPLHFSCINQFPEDYINVSYLQDCATQAGIKTNFISVPNIGWNGQNFTDQDENKINNIFKLYPWEWMVNEEFGQHILKSNTTWIEPSWKMILSNKAILPILWKLFPGHPNLLETYFDDPEQMTSYVEKPLFSREGANITIVEDGLVTSQTKGEYGDEGFVYQQLQKLPNFDGNFPVLGSWIIGGQAAGMGIRETTSLITDNFSRFIPHAIAS
ncbi:MAG TPA: glutathionylspermidine synthase family protein [Bacteroidia bacterium]|jgi:glutathionylspermidine synthase|nr:glutathionylspermidine synthase family protein [Bacteroidia bacterium]